MLPLHQVGAVIIMSRHRDGVLSESLLVSGPYRAFYRSFIGQADQSISFEHALTQPGELVEVAHLILVSAFESTPPSSTSL